jgi:hypothetical protein
MHGDILSEKSSMYVNVKIVPGEWEKCDKMTTEVSKRYSDSPSS